MPNFTCFANYVFEHTGGKGWIVLDRPSKKHPDKFRLTHKQYDDLKRQYQAKFGFSPLSDEYVAAFRQWERDNP